MYSNNDYRSITIDVLLVLVQYHANITFEYFINVNRRYHKILTKFNTTFPFCFSTLVRTSSVPYVKDHVVP